MGFAGELDALVPGRQTFRRFADAEISSAADILVVNGIAALGGRKLSRPEARTMGIEGPRADGYRKLDIQPILELVRPPPPPIRWKTAQEGIWRSQPSFPDRQLPRLVRWD